MNFQIDQELSHNISNCFRNQRFCKINFIAYNKHEYVLIKQIDYQRCIFQALAQASSERLLKPAFSIKLR